MATAVIFSPVFYKHNPGIRHPESSRRLRVIIQELKKLELQGVKEWQFIKPKRSCLKNVRLVHGAKYIEFVKNVCRLGGDVLDPEGDTVASPESFDVALHAVGGTLKAVNLVMQGKFRNAFALVRPPGHHAGKYHAGGFCIFNNIAVAAKYLLERFKLNKVLILDIDAHHGDGTQEIFYSNDRVLYVGLHEDPRSFPGRGFIDEIGEEEGLGFNVNIPLPFRTTDQIYLKALSEIVEPIIQQYEPQFMLISAGLDGHYTDPVGSLSLSAFCYLKVYDILVNLASELCNGRLIFVLEGGYSLNFVGKLGAAAIAKMSRVPYKVEDKAPATQKYIKRQGEKVIKEVKRLQKNFWNI